jgi:type I restriction enzyme M protein
MEIGGAPARQTERLRGKFKAHEYQTVILPIITIRRLECVLLTWRDARAEEVRRKRPDIGEEELTKLIKNFELSPNYPGSPGFSNQTTWTLRKIYEEDQTLLEKNFRAYLNGFSENVQDVLDSFDYAGVVGKMVKNARLAPILN